MIPRPGQTATLKNRLRWFILFLLVLCGCNSPTQTPSFSDLAEEFVYTSLSYSPVAATQIGYHRHGDRQLDALLDDYGSAALERQRRWYQDFRLRLQRSFDPRQLAPEERADYEIIQHQISLALFDLTTIQSYRHNPTLYVELIGNALYNPFILEYADKQTRYGHIIERLRAVPGFARQAQLNLDSSPEIWTDVAVNENDGNIGLIEGPLLAGCPTALRTQFDEAAAVAVRALKTFNQWLREDLRTRSCDWRLGGDRYEQKFRYALATDNSPQQVLRAAEEQMNRARQQMYAIALPMYRKAGPRQDLRSVVSTVLAQIAQRHSTPESYFSDAGRDLQEVRAFVKEKDLLTLPQRDNLQVIETPPFMRGIYAVGGFSPAPALQPQLGAFYWLTPIPPDWPKDRIESKLREYNYYGLKLLTIHEAVPGHYVQFEYANDVQPPLRRILRSVFGNGPYIEGWGIYSTEMTLDEGYLDHSEELRLTFLKQQLRVFANAILDIRLQTMGMTDQQALDLMMEGAFQEREEATAKLSRAKLSSTQLPTYFVGWRDWHRLRERYRSEKGVTFALGLFHQQALQAGAVPLPVLSELLTGKKL